MATKKFPDKTPGEKKLCTFDFSNEVAAGSTLSNPAIAKALVDGDDTGAALLTLGTPAVTPATALVKVLVGVGKEANKYKLTMTVDADNGEIHQLAGTMAVKESAA